MKTITEEQYLSINGSGKQGFGDCALHKNKGNHSDKTWSRITSIQADKDRELLREREVLRSDYAEKVKSGQLRPPTRLERLIDTAKGHPDNEATKAAKRLLKKIGAL